MKFTSKQKNDFLNNLALKTQQGIWMTEMAISKTQEKLNKKKALLDELKTKLENKEFSNARDGKDQIKFTEDKIAELETELEEATVMIADGQADLYLIEQYRSK